MKICISLKRNQHIWIFENSFWIACVERFRGGLVYINYIIDADKIAGFYNKLGTESGCYTYFQNYATGAAHDSGP